MERYLFAYGTLRHRATDRQKRILQGFKMFAPVGDGNAQIGFPCVYYGNSSDYIYGNLIKVEDWQPYDMYESEGSLYDRIDITQAVEDQKGLAAWGLSAESSVQIYVAGEHLMRYQWKPIGPDWLNQEEHEGEFERGSEIAHSHKLYKIFFHTGEEILEND